MESMAAVVKEMKNGFDDARMMELGTKADHTAKTPGQAVGAIDASGGAGGEFRQMTMDSRGQAVVNNGSTRPMLPSHVTGQVGASLARAVSQGDTELKLQLKPPELGRIIMTIDNVGTSLKVSVVTESHAAKEILAAHANELKATLASSGISIGSFDVEMGSDFSQSMADARHHSKGSGSRRGRNRGAGIEEVDSDSKIDVRGFAGDARLLHLVA
jgi:flagellar hook-length control protein FliK